MCINATVSSLGFTENRCYTDVLSGAMSPVYTEETNGLAVVLFQLAEAVEVNSVDQEANSPPEFRQIDQALLVVADGFSDAQPIEVNFDLDGQRRNCSFRNMFSRCNLS